MILPIRCKCTHPGSSVGRALECGKFCSSQRFHTQKLVGQRHSDQRPSALGPRSAIRCSSPPHRSSNGALAHGAPNARRTSRRANEKRCSLMLHWSKGGGGGISAYLEPHVLLCTGCCHAALHRDAWRLTRALRPRPPAAAHRLVALARRACSRRAPRAWLASRRRP